MRQRISRHNARPARIFHALAGKAVLAIAITCCATIAPVSVRAEPPAAGSQVFADLGGLAGVRRIVDDLLTIALQDTRIAHTFEDVDMERLARMLTDQFCMLTGGPCRYEGDDMKEVHAGLELTNAHFNALAEDLHEAMIRNGVPVSAQYALLAKLAPMQRDIVTR